jgi:hypothetical protein
MPVVIARVSKSELACGGRVEVGSAVGRGGSWVPR